jgi:hypothetical protein
VNLGIALDRGRELGLFAGERGRCPCEEFEADTA